MTDTSSYSVDLIGDEAEFIASMQAAVASARESAAEIAATFDSVKLDGLETNMADAGAASGAALRDGVAAETGGLEADMAAAGAQAGTAMRDEVKDSASGMADDLADAGVLAGSGARDGVKEGAEGMEDDLKDAGEDAGKGLSDGVEKGSSGVKAALGNLGVPGGLLNGWVALGAGVAGAAAASMKAAETFQTSETLLVTGAGESTKNLAMVSNGILDMAGTVGISADNLSKGMFLIESAGFHGAQGLTVLKSAAEGAAVGGADMSTVADVLTTALHDYSIPADHANQVTSALIETVASGKTNLDALAGSLGKVMPTASALGVSFQDVTGAMATMTNAGLSARLASQHLNNTLLAISAPSATATTAMQQVGLNTQQVKNALDGPGGLSAALQLVTDAVGKKFPAGSVQAVTAMKTILGGATGYSTALMLTGANQQTFEENTKNIAKVLDGSSKSVQGFAATQKDLKFQMDRAKDGIDAVGIELGEKFLPAFAKVAQAAAKFISGLVADLPGAISDISKGFDAIKPGLELFVKLAGDAIKFIIDHKPLLIAALAAIAVAFFPVTTAVVGLALAASEVIKHWSGIKDFFVGIWHDIYNTIEPFVGAIKGEFDLLAGIFKVEWDAIAMVVSDAWDVITGVISAAWDVIRGIFSVAIDVLTGDWSGAWNAIRNTVSGVLNAVSGIVRGVVGGLVTFLGQAWNDVSGTTTAVWNAIKGYLSDAWNDIKTVFMDATIVGLLLSHWTQIESDAESVWNAIVSFITGIPSWIISALSSLGSDLIGVASAAWNGFSGAISSGWNTVETFFESIPGKIEAVFKDADTWLLDAGEDIIKGLINGIKGMVGDAVDAAKSAGKGIVSGVKGVLGIGVAVKVLHDIGVFTMQGLANGEMEAGSLAVAAAAKVANQISLIPFTAPVPSAAAAAASGGTAGPLGATAPLLGGGGNHTEVNINNPATVQTPNQIAYAVSLELKKAGL